MNSPCHRIAKAWETPTQRDTGKGTITQMSGALTLLERQPIRVLAPPILPPQSIELRHLRYFVAVAETLSFTNAALKLRIAQPSLTRQIRNLEEQLGVRLLVRTSRNVALTQEGCQFLHDSKKLLALFSASVAAAQTMPQADSSQLNIGYVASAHHDLLPETLGVFRKLYPDVTMNLFDMQIAEQCLALDGRRIDLGFVGMRPGLDEPDLSSACVAHDRIVAALPARHPLATKPMLHILDLASQFFVGVSAKTNPTSQQWLMETCRRSGFEAIILQEVDTDQAAINFVADALGVALLPEQVAGFSHEGVVLRPFSPQLSRESTIAWRTDNSSKPLRDYTRIVMDLSASRHRGER